MKPRIRVLKVNQQNLLVALTPFGYVTAFTWQMLQVKLKNPQHFPKALHNQTLSSRIRTGGLMKGAYYELRSSLF